MALPVVEDPSQVLACDACHGSKIVLPDLLTDDDPTGRLLPEMIRQLQHRPRDPTFERKEATGCYYGVCVAQIQIMPAIRDVPFSVFLDKTVAARFS